MPAPKYLDMIQFLAGICQCCFMGDTHFLDPRLEVTDIFEKWGHDCGDQANNSGNVAEKVLLPKALVLEYV